MSRARIVFVAPLAVLIGAIVGMVWGALEGVAMALGELQRGWNDQ